MSVTITIEGIARSGKTTLAREIADRLRLFGINVVIDDEDTPQFNDRPNDDVIEIDHLNKMRGIAQSSEEHPIKVVTRYPRLEEATHVQDQWNEYFSEEEAKSEILPMKSIAQWNFSLMPRDYVC